MLYQSFHGFLCFYFASGCKLRPLCHNLNSFLQILWKIFRKSKTKLLFSLRGWGHSPLGPLLSCPFLSETNTDSPHHTEYIQPLSCWKLTNCQLFPQIRILHSLFSKHLNSIMYAHSATRNYRKLTHSLISRSWIDVLGLVFTCHLGFRMHEEKLKNWGQCLRGLDCEMAENCSEPGKDFPAQRAHREKSWPAGAFHMRDPSIQFFLF